MREMRKEIRALIRSGLEILAGFVLAAIVLVVLAEAIVPGEEIRELELCREVGGFQQIYPEKMDEVWDLVEVVDLNLARFCARDLRYGEASVATSGLRLTVRLIGTDREGILHGTVVTKEFSWREGVSNPVIVIESGQLQYRRGASTLVWSIIIFSGILAFVAGSAAVSWYLKSLPKAAKETAKGGDS